jgi:hypothetical protein
MPYKDSSYIDNVGDLKLWRYMSFTKFMNLIMTDTLHFHNAEGFTDNFEGSVPEAVKNAMEEEYKKAHQEGDFPENGLEIHKNLVGVLRKFTYLSCWHNKETESAAMWSKYGGHDGAIAIETSVQKLKRALFDSDHQIYIAEVDYHIFKEEYRDEEGDEIPDADAEKLNPEFLLTREESHSFAPFLYKRKSFDFEEEVRAIIQKPPHMEAEDGEKESPIQINTDEDEEDNRYLNLDAEPEKAGYDVGIYVEDLIEKIHVAPETPGWVLETIRRAVQAKEELPDGDDEIKSFVVESQLDANPIFGTESES